MSLRTISLSLSSVLDDIEATTVKVHAVRLELNAVAFVAVVYYLCYTRPCDARRVHARRVQARQIEAAAVFILYCTYGLHD